MSPYNSPPRSSVTPPLQKFSPPGPFMFPQPRRMPAPYFQGSPPYFHKSSPGHSSTPPIYNSPPPPNSMEYRCPLPMRRDSMTPPIRPSTPVMIPDPHLVQNVTSPIPQEMLIPDSGGLVGNRPSLMIEYHGNCPLSMSPQIMRPQIPPSGKPPPGPPNLPYNPGNPGQLIMNPQSMMMNRPVLQNQMVLMQQQNAGMMPHPNYPIIPPQHLVNPPRHLVNPILGHQIPQQQQLHSQNTAQQLQQQQLQQQQQPMLMMQSQHPLHMQSQDQIYMPPQNMIQHPNMMLQRAQLLAQHPNFCIAPPNIMPPRNNRMQLYDPAIPNTAPIPNPGSNTIPATLVSGTVPPPIVSTPSISTSLPLENEKDIERDESPNSPEAPAAAPANTYEDTSNKKYERINSFSQSPTQPARTPGLIRLPPSIPPNSLDDVNKSPDSPPTPMHVKKNYWQKSSAAEVEEKPSTASKKLDAVSEPKKEATPEVSEAPANITPATTTSVRTVSPAMPSTTQPKAKKAFNLSDLNSLVSKTVKHNNALPRTDITTSGSGCVEVTYTTNRVRTANSDVKIKAVHDDRASDEKWRPGFKEKVTAERSSNWRRHRTGGSECEDPEREKVLREAESQNLSTGQSIQYAIEKLRTTSGVSTPAGRSERSVSTNSASELDGKEDWYDEEDEDKIDCFDLNI